ncbi:hypothetical protein GKZ28_00815 [Clostridium chromiireducens]|uniref:Uncharacterized protein n=1 Tax=Clostridium chromiireducens TaxID=225345 RepID=A0A964W063_9CLOT|nr:hypothetical protein [Clostridium chromiireducens]MVX62241.1 hypothetical protein [Clostridium chromiireducens]
MGLPKSVTKIKKGNVEFVSNVDRVNYTLNELTRAALRDVGKFICNKFRNKYYGIFKRKKGKVGRYTQYWVRKKECDLQVGLKPFAFYGGFQELGSSKTKKLGLLQKTVEENIDQIRLIQGKYLSAIEDENRAVGLIDEKEYEGGTDG